MTHGDCFAYIMYRPFLVLYYHISWVTTQGLLQANIAQKESARWAELAYIIKTKSHIISLTSHSKIKKKYIAEQR